MNGLEAGVLLSMAAAADGRHVGDAEQAMWLGLLVDLPFEVTRAALIGHYREDRRRIAPADLRHRVRAIRRAEAETEHSREILAAARAGATVIDSCGLPVGDDPAQATRNSPELHALHLEANTQPCRDCAAPIGEHCRNTRTGNTTKIPHPHRTLTARKSGVQ